MATTTEYAARLTVAREKLKSLKEEVHTRTYQVEKYLDEIKSKKAPEQDEQRLRNIEDTCAAMRAWADEL